jgi:hypothetical protein
VAVKTGISNGGFTAVEGQISEGDLVIVGTMTQNNTKTATPQQSPLSGGGAPGMGRRF